MISRQKLQIILQEKEIDELREDVGQLQAENELLKSSVCAVALHAHMMGQAECGVDPSFSLAQEYAEKMKAGAIKGEDK